MEYDFIAIGDTVTDAFIRLKEAEVHCDINKENCTISMRFADKIPYESVTVLPAVGNSANAAVSAARLGLTTALVTDIGADRDGDDALTALGKNNVATNYVTKHDGMKTNYHYVLWYAADRTILIKHEEYPYKLADIGSPKFIYLSSLGENSLPWHQEFAKYLVAHPEVKLAFQPGTFQMRFGTEALKDIYARTEIFFCNVEEAQRILKTEEADVKKLLAMIHALGPKTVVITDGPKGAHASDGTHVYFMPPYPDPKPPYERTGAGDAFSSTVTVALAYGKSLPEALMWGPVNSMSVVQYIGAQEGLLTRDKLEGYLSQAPATYVASVVVG